MSESVFRPTASVGRDLPFVQDALSSESIFLSVTAVVGGTWGAVEITLGGFLHALRLPFVGLVMALLQAGFFIALRRVHPMRGLMAFSALLAAAVKLMVPSGALLAPSLGIVVEGLLLEVAFLLLPGFWAAPLGAALALVWALVQMVVSQVVLLGWNVLAVYQALLDSIAGALGWNIARGGGGAAFVLLLGLGGLVGSWARRIGARLALEIRDPDSERLARVSGFLEAGNNSSSGALPDADPVWDDIPGQAAGRRVVPAVPRKGDHPPTGRAGGWAGWRRAALFLACLSALVSLARPGIWSLLGLALLTLALGVFRPAWLAGLLRWRFWLFASVLALATGLALTASRASGSGVDWMRNALAAASLLLVRVAILSETAILAVAWLRMGSPVGRWRRLGVMGRAMAATWSILPGALILLESEMASVRGRSTRWERLRSLPGILESLLLWALLLADGGNRLRPADVSGVKGG